MGVKTLTLGAIFALAACARAEPQVEVVHPGPTATPPAFVNLPPPPLLTPAGHTLILEFETGGRSGYDPHPEWPGGASGVTIGVGYDLGYYRSSVIDADWHELGNAPRARLLTVQGRTGARAHNALPIVRDIFILWHIAIGVFDKVDVAREFADARHALPGFEDLRPNAQAALISLGFNRGWSMIGPNRTEMREIRSLVPARDYDGIALQLRKMIRVWSGTAIENGMRRRRLAEADLVETP